MSTGVLSARQGVHHSVTSKIVEAIRAGAEAFVMPWHSRGGPIARPINALTGAGYRGVNVVALWAASVVAGYGSGTWATYRQWQEVGAQVRRGEAGSVVVFYKPLQREDEPTDDGDAVRWVARAFRVFNAAQVDGWVPREDPEPATPAEILGFVETFVSAAKAKVREGACARYLIREDEIEIPARRRFVGTPTSSPTESYYATLLHELVHWTGATHRLNRTFGTRFGDHTYAVEELVAELGAAFLCADLEVTNEPRADHAAYLQHWLTVLEADPGALFVAATQASIAAEYLWSLTGSST